MTLMETLYDEHEKIAAFIETLQQKCVALMEHGTFDAQEFYDAIRHIREYADKEHHQKEERLLFRAMVKELGPAAENLVQHGMLVEHDMELVMDISEEITVVNFGRRIACGTASEVQSNEDVIEAYLGRSDD